MENRKLVSLIMKDKENDIKATFELILQFEDLINKESIINGILNQDCKDYIIDKLLKQIKKLKKFNNLLRFLIFFSPMCVAR